MPALQHSPITAGPMPFGGELSLIEWARHIEAVAGDALVSDWCEIIREEIDKASRRGALTTALADGLIAFFDLEEANA